MYYICIQDSAMLYIYDLLHFNSHICSHVASNGDISIPLFSGARLMLLPEFAYDEFSPVIAD